MNRLEMQQELAFRLNFTEDDVDQDFTEARLQKLLQQAYNRLVEKAKQVGSKKQFLDASADQTWESDEQTFTVPDALVNKAIVDIYDITDGEPGFPLVAADDGLSSGDYFWKDRETLQWNNVGGPSSDRTLRFYYTAIAEELNTDGSVPRLIPPQFHELIVSEAAIKGRTYADESAPSEWRHDHNEMWLDFAKWISLGKPLSNTPQVRAPISEDPGIVY